MSDKNTKQTTTNTNSSIVNKKIVYESTSTTMSSLTVKTTTSSSSSSSSNLIQTSTPSHSAVLSNSTNTGGILSYFTSPNATSIGNGLAEAMTNLNDIDVSAHGLNSATRSQSTAGIMTNGGGAGHQVNNVVINPIPIVISKSNSINDSSNTTNNDDVISCQYIKKVFLSQNESKEAELRAKEKYLNHLKSIDLKKYSFPNENKPRTDYTYAKSSSYLKESKEADDNYEIPNLCRRSRIPSFNLTQPNTLKSPQQSHTTANSFVNDTSDHVGNLTTALDTRRRRSSILEYIVQRFYTSKETTKTTNLANTLPINPSSSSSSSSSSTTTTTSIKPVLSQATAFNRLPLNRNIGSELNDNEILLREKNNYFINNLYGLDSDRITPENAQQLLDKKNSNQTGSASISPNKHSSSSSSSVNFRRVSSSTTNMQQMASTSAGAGAASLNNLKLGSNRNENNHYEPRQQTTHRKSKCFSCFALPLVLLLILIPFGLFAAKRIENKQDFTLNQQLVNDFKFFMNKELIRPCLFHLNKFYLEAESLWTYYKPLQYLNSTIYNLKNRAIYYLGTKTIQIRNMNDVNLMPAAVSPAFNFVESNLYSEEILKDISSLKEKIQLDVNAKLKDFKNNEKLVDSDIMQKELDDKFNYTLHMISNKLIQQSIQIESSKIEQEKELEKIKQVLNELESRYTHSLSQLQEQLAKQRLEFEQQQEKLKQQQQEQSASSSSSSSSATISLLESEAIRSTLKEALAEELISFEKIEEYINRTFYLYNADKTGMTDFASESAGGSIMFTRCTEDYLDNSRWYTIFDLPITRMRVSPRVVIQNSIQPGNCWSFKGSKADLFIKLAAKITPTSFSIEHIPKEISITGTIDSAPQNFTVYGYTNPDEINDEQRLLLGNYRYDNNSKNTLQIFNAQHEYPDKPIRVTELKIESNAGNKDYTCLYKFRVHGKLFTNKETNQQQQQQQETSSSISENPNENKNN